MGKPATLWASSLAWPTSRSSHAVAIGELLDKAAVGADDEVVYGASLPTSTRSNSAIERRSST